VEWSRGNGRGKVVMVGGDLGSVGYIFIAEAPVSDVSFYCGAEEEIVFP
jgi:hypothetical protein